MSLYVPEFCCNLILPPLVNLKMCVPGVSGISGFCITGIQGQRRVGAQASACHLCPCTACSLLRWLALGAEG